MLKIVISYRREGSASVAGRIYDRLCDHYGRDAIFRDIDALPLGADFREHLEQILNDADALICIIGGRWLGKSRRGPSRISNPGDYIRLEVETALLRKIPVIPVLIDKTRMPASGDLPESMHGLLFKHAMTLDQLQDFDVHTKRLIDGLDRTLPSMRPARSVQPEKPVHPVPETQAPLERNAKIPRRELLAPMSRRSKFLFGLSMLQGLPCALFAIALAVIGPTAPKGGSLILLALTVTGVVGLQPFATFRFRDKSWVAGIPMTAGAIVAIGGTLLATFDPMSRVVSFYLVMSCFFVVLLALSVSLYIDDKERRAGWRP